MLFCTFGSCRCRSPCGSSGTGTTTISIGFGAVRLAVASVDQPATEAPQARLGRDQEERPVEKGVVFAQLLFDAGACDLGHLLPVLQGADVDLALGRNFLQKNNSMGFL